MLDYPLYPMLSDEAEKEAQILLNEFTDKIKEATHKIVEKAIDEFYCNIIPFIGSDSWTNFRNQIMDGFKNYDNRKIQNAFDFKEIRQQIYKEFRDDIVKDLDQDNLEEIKELKKEIEILRRWNQR